MQTSEFEDNRWNHLKRILERNSPLAHPDFSPSPDLLDFIINTCRILVIGAGGLGCELLKDLALLGFLNLDVIDMDTIDLSNLNRQFLYRQNDVGKSKAEVAANFIKKRISGAKVKPHFCKIQDYDSSFYQGFHVVVCGVDSVIARRWINGMLVSLLEYDEEGNVKPETIVPLVDGGTEGFKGNARVVLPGMSACVECTLWLYPPQINYPMCTIAHTPRQPEHCIEYVKIFGWQKEQPFGDVSIDGDNPKHIEWIMNSAISRANEYGIQGVTYRLTQGVVKRIIPAVASTNAVIAAACANEVFKLVTQCCQPLNNYMLFNDVSGVYTHTFEAGRSEDCLVCSQKPRTLNFRSTDRLRDIVEYLRLQPDMQFKRPTLTTMVDDKNKTLYMSNIPSLELATRPNLAKTLADLDMGDGSEIICADPITPNSLRFILRFTDNDMQTS